MRRSKVDSIKPRIVVISPDDDVEFTWLSDGWNSIELGTRGTKRAVRLMGRAHRAIEAATDVQDAIRRLRQEGFEVVRNDD